MHTNIHTYAYAPGCCVGGQGGAVFLGQVIAPQRTVQQRLQHAALGQLFLARAAQLLHTGQVR